MGSAVDEPNLDRLMQSYHDAGFGGVEITPIYGAIGYEQRYIPFLSPQWNHMLAFTVQKAASLQMGVDMNTGTGWPFGGPQITPELAAGKLFIQTYPVPGGQSLSGNIVIETKGQAAAGARLQAVLARSEQGESMLLTNKVDAQGKLDWTAPAGNWTLYAAFAGKTAQAVKRAAPGGEGLVMDHFSAEAVNTYLERFDSSFGSKPTGVRAFFNDSYEVYNADWSPGFFDEFRRRRGYDLRLHLDELARKEVSENTGRVKADYRQTISDLLLDHFTRIWSGWAHRQKAMSRNQAHGSPANILDLYGTVDVPECEGFFGLSKFDIPNLRHDTADIRDSVFHDPLMFQFAASAAHFYQKPLVSSETFVWLTEHFNTSFSQCKPEVEELFVSGINHVFYHGTTYSPQDVPWPGWNFYASSNFVPANPLWPQLPALNGYITRCQSLLQNSTPDNELMVYWPVYDLWSDPKGMEMQYGMHTVDNWLYPTPFYNSLKRLKKEGYQFDYVSDKMIGELTDAAHAAWRKKVLVIPACRFMPAQTLQQILRFVQQGGRVVFEKLPEDVPGLANLEANRTLFRTLTGQLQQLTKTGNFQIAAADKILPVMKTVPEDLPRYGLEFIRKQVSGGHLYFVVNHSAKAVDALIPFHSTAASALLMDPQSGQTGAVQPLQESGTVKIRLQLEPGEAMFIRLDDRKKPGATWTYLEKQNAPLPLAGPWSLRFTAGGPALPHDTTLGNLVSWTAFPDTAAVAFSGTGDYNTRFTLSGPLASEYLLDLGEVFETAHIWINGQDAGFIWSFPYRKRIRAFLKPGINQLRIEVANLMANRIRDMDRRKISWRNYHEINFVNIHYKPFDASGWQPRPSGLVGPVTIVPVQVAEK